MDLGIYTSKNSYSKRSTLPKREKFCLNCGKFIEDAESFLGKSSFCSPGCKEEYIQPSRER